MSEEAKVIPEVEEITSEIPKKGHTMVSGRLTQDEWDRLAAVNAARRKKGYDETMMKTLVNMFNAYEDDEFGMFYTGK